MTNKTGGPAFPSQYDLPENQGLTMRDYFAAKAMQGMLASSNNVLFLRELAMEAYTYADAMLAERAK